MHVNRMIILWLYDFYPSCKYRLGGLVTDFSSYVFKYSPLFELVLHAYEFVFTLHKYYFYLFPVTTNESKYEGLEFHMGIIARNNFFSLACDSWWIQSVFFSQNTELPAKADL